MSKHMLTQVLQRTTLLLGVALCLQPACRNTPGPGNRPVCTTDEDCPGDLRCVTNGLDEVLCAPCGVDTDCECFEACIDNDCQPVGAEETSQTQNALGNWTGAPGGPDYVFNGTCTEDNDCSLGQICNPLTGGCVAAADYLTSCNIDNPCDETGVNGEVLACALDRSLCLPAALCRSDHNCCGTPTFFCESGGAETLGLCRAVEAECTPPSTIETECPFSPQIRDTCPVGRFCSRRGQCVQCACDDDCTGGLLCFQALGECRGANFCLQAGDCTNPGESCDTSNQVCASTCDPANPSAVCTALEFCDPTDTVCRPLSELPCEDDRFEPNPTLASAVANSISVPVPGVGQQSVLEDLSLCTSPGGNVDEDWFVVPLTAGDDITITGFSAANAQADLRIYATDGETQLDSALISASGSELEFVANVDGDYFLQVVQRDEEMEGDYRLTTIRTTAVACDDPFEDQNGVDDLIDNATVMLDFENTDAPIGCQRATLGETETVTCDDALNLCAGDIDYYLINVPNSGEVRVQLSNFAPSLNLALYGPYPTAADADTSVLADVDDFGALLKQVSDVARPAGWYLVRVSRLSGPVTPYELRIEVTSADVACVEDPFDATPTTPAFSSPVTQTDDVDGFNDSLATASTIALIPGAPPAPVLSVGTASMQGLELCRADEDWFRLGIWDNVGMTFVPPEAGQRIRARVIPSPASTGVLTLSAGTAAALNQGSSDPENPADSVFLSQTSGADFYYLRVLGSSDNTGSLEYELELILEEPPACGDDDLGDDGVTDNDSPATAYTLETEPTGEWPDQVGEGFEFPTDSLSGGTVSLCPADDDWYRISVPVGSEVLAWVVSDPTVADVGVYLYDDSVVDESAPTAGSVPPITGFVDFNTLSGRAYHRVRGNVSGEAFIMVRNTSGWPLLDYQLGVRFIPTVCTEDMFETPAPGNDSWDVATQLPLSVAPYDPQLETAILDPLAMCDGGAEEDWYRAFLNPEDRVRLSIFYEPTEGDLDLSMFPAGPGGLNTLLASDDDDGVSPTGRLEVDVTLDASAGAGDYLFKVEPFGVPTSIYYLDAEVTRACVDDSLEPPPPDELSMVTWMSTSTDLGTLQLCNDDDWVSFDVPANIDATICALFVHDDNDVDLRVWDASEVDTTGSVPVPLLAPGFSSRSKDNVERVVVPGDPSGNSLILQTSLDTARPETTATYDLRLFEGTVACPCLSGYAGSLCEECPGGANNPCSGNGTCMDAGERAECTCNPGFYGFDCQRTCPGGLGNACFGNGTCDDGATGTGTCTCDPGYYGLDCRLECPGGAATPCSGNGMCDDGSTGSGNCTCDAGWLPPDCSIPE